MRPTDKIDDPCWEDLWDRDAEIKRLRELLKSRAKEPIIVYTGAPAAADYDQSVTLETFMVEGRTCREVLIDAEDYQRAYQCDRYRSFPGGFVTLDDPRTHPLGTGEQAPTLR